MKHIIDLSKTTIYLDGSKEDSALLADFLAQSAQAGQAVETELSKPGRKKAKKRKAENQKLSSQNIVFAKQELDKQ